MATIGLKHNKNKDNAANLRALQRVDKGIIQILAHTSHVAAYAFDLDRMRWRSMDVEGTMYIVKRSDKDPEYMLVILNRNNPDDMGKDITANLEFEVNEGYLMVRPNGDNAAIDAFWFHDTHEREVITALLQMLVESLKRGVPMTAKQFKAVERDMNRRHDAATKAANSPALKPADGGNNKKNKKKNSSANPKNNGVKNSPNNKNHGVKSKASPLPAQSVAAAAFVSAIDSKQLNGSSKQQNNQKKLMNVSELKAVLLDLVHDDTFVLALHAAYAAKQQHGGRR